METNDRCTLFSMKIFKGHTMLEVVIHGYLWR